MDEHRLHSLLDRFPQTRVLVIGDFFLDFYLDIDRTLSETSLETGLEAYQVVRVRSSPGAAGTVTSNLRALDVQVTALGVLGDDGMGYELLRGLRERGVNVERMIQSIDHLTPTYIKPMLQERDEQTDAVYPRRPAPGPELNRLDIKNRRPLPAAQPDASSGEEQIIAHLHELVTQVDGIVVADQVQERNCGVITDRVRAELAELGAAHPEVTIAVDSRVRIGEYRSAILKPNANEAVRAVYPDWAGGEPDAAPRLRGPTLRGAAAGMDRAVVTQCGQTLCRQTGRPVFVTVGADGVLVFDSSGAIHVEGVHVPPPIDIVGAGDSVMAGIVSSLCCGASPAEAAQVGNLVASITIQQIGTTGTATRDQVMERHREVADKR